MAREQRPLTPRSYPMSWGCAPLTWRWCIAIPRCFPSVAAPRQAVGQWSAARRCTWPCRELARNWLVWLPTRWVVPRRTSSKPGPVPGILPGRCFGIQRGDASTRRGSGGGLDFTEKFTLSATPYAFAAHVAVVEVSRETGDVKILQYAAVHDCGRIINPMLVEG